MSAIDLEIAALIGQWQAHAQLAVELGLRMGQRLIELERQRDDLRIGLRIAHSRVAELEATVASLRGRLQ